MTKVLGVQVYKNLAWLNGLDADAANAALLRCCRSREWSRRMERKRPFAMIEDVFAAAENVWSTIAMPDRLEALARCEINVDADTQGDDFNKAKELYRNKFGFEFVVEPGEKSAGEVASICSARLGNSVATERRLAAAEQSKIIERQLTLLLEK
ncbi:MAG: 2-oxo-4-hydroxy-4-carboxy-5-ureidoimidazoline decarboxylase [Pyrinomonadaceae bacterium]